MRSEIKTLQNECNKKMEIAKVNLLRNKGLTLKEACSTVNITVDHYRYNMKKINKNETKRNSISINKIINPILKNNLKPKSKRNSKKQVGGQNENSNIDYSNIKSPPSDELFENPILVSNSKKTILKPKEQPTPKAKPKPKPKPQAKPKPKPQAQAKPKPKPKPELEPQLKSSTSTTEVVIGGGNNKSYMTDNSSIDSMDTLSDSIDSISSPPQKPKAKPKPKPKPQAANAKLPVDKQIGGEKLDLENKNIINIETNKLSELKNNIVDNIKAQPKPKPKTANKQKNQTGGNIENDIQKEEIKKGMEKIKKLQQEVIDIHNSGSYSDSDSVSDIQI